MINYLKNFVIFLEISEIFNDERFNTNSLRSKNMEELKIILENKLSSKNYFWMGISNGERKNSLWTNI